MLGAGSGGLAAAAQLGEREFDVVLWSRPGNTFDALQKAGSPSFEGVFGSGRAQLALLTDSLAAALRGTDAAVVCLPAFALGPLADALAALDADVPLVLNPGGTGGALNIATRLRASGARPIPIAEFSTLTYVARKAAADRVEVSAVAGRVRSACLPGGEEALQWARELYPQTRAERDVLATSLANVNLVLHPPGAILAAAWVEASKGDFLFYAQATTPAVARTMAALDSERLSVASAFGHELDPLLEEMRAIGTIDDGAANDLGAAIRSGRANAAIRAPTSLADRYYREDLPFALRPFCELAQTAGVQVPTADALRALAETVLPAGTMDDGLGLEGMGLADAGLEETLGRVAIGAQPS